MSNPLQKLHGFGQSFWWDSLSRHAIESGEMARMRDEDGMRGITSNPAIFQTAIARGNDYDARIQSLLDRASTAEAMFWELAIADIQDACDLLRALYDESDGGDGFVSLEVNPHLANDGPGSLAQAKELWSRVDRPNLMIKIPGTAAGVPAIREALRDGLNINITLLFSQRAHMDVMEAYIEALEARMDAGKPIERIASVASFFVSRVDTLVDGRLEQIGGPEARALLGKAGIANAKLAYENFLSRFEDARWERLASNGARVQRPLWASTSTKNPDYSPTLYVGNLVGRDTVNTIPTSTIDAYREQGDGRADAIREGVAEARGQIEALAALGIDMDQVTAQLLEEGVEKFNAAFDSLLEDLDAKLKSLSIG
jgi:transaldolase